MDTEKKEKKIVELSACCAVNSILEFDNAMDQKKDKKLEGKKEVTLRELEEALWAE